MFGDNNEVRNYLSKHQKNAGKHLDFTYEKEISVQDFH